MGNQGAFNVTRRTGLYLTVVILSVIFILGFCAYMVLVLNVKPIHTVLLPPGMPGMLTSEINMSARFWLAMWLLPFKGLFIIYLLLVVAWGDKNQGCSWFWFVMMVLVTLVDVTSFGSLAVMGTNANGPGQKGNLANDQLYCCVHGSEGIEATGCPSDVTCTAPIDMRPEITGDVEQSDLKWNNDFKWLFYTGVAFIAYYIIFYTVVFTAMCWEPTILPGDRDILDPTQQHAITQTAPLKAPPVETVGAPVTQMPPQQQHGATQWSTHMRKPNNIPSGSYIKRYTDD